MNNTIASAVSLVVLLAAGGASAAVPLATATRTCLPLTVGERLKEDVVEKRYELPVEIPAEAAGRRVAVSFDLVNTRADVFLDGEPAGTCVFPCGEVDLTALAKPGETQTLAIEAKAYPPQEGALVFNAPDRAELRKVNLRNRGVTGAVRLETMPAGPRIADSTVETSVARGEITFVADLAGLPKDAAGARYVLSALVAGCGAEKRFESGALAPGTNGAVRFTAPWKDAELWDTHTPRNLYVCSLSLRAADGALLDEALPFRFGFREVTLAGRDILLNGVPIHLRAQVCKAMNATDGSYATGFETATNLLARGWNFVIADNYNFRPGCLAATEGFLTACDDAGLLCSFTLPSLNDFDEAKLRDDPETQRVFRELTRQAVRMARRHPSVIFYAMNHNRLGYAGDMDPLRIGVGYDIVSEIERDPDLGPSMQWMVWRRRLGERCRAVAEDEDPTRPVYHHSSGDLGRFHTCNIYLDFAPVQERSDWLSDWSGRGTKPVFFVEWGAPHIANWSSYRGPLFIHSKHVLQSLWASEYAAEFRGEAAYEPTPEARAALAGEEALWEKGPFRWWQLAAFLRPLTENYHGVVARYVADNWRSHRAWGASAMLPWDQGDDFLPGTATLSPRGEAFARWNAPECAFIGGDGVFTDKRHLFRPGETVRKTLVILNDRRVPATVRYRAEFAPEGKGRGADAIPVAEGEVEVPAGGRRDVPVSFVLPEGADGGTLRATFDYGGGAAPQSDAFAVRAVRPPAKRGEPPAKLLLYDPKGLTKATFDRLGIAYEETDLSRPLPPRARLVVGRESLTPGLYRRRLLQAFDTFVAGRVLVFEQTAETLSAIGFRVQEHGLRQVFPRYESAFLPGLDDPEMLRDWAGEATLLPPYVEDRPDIEWTYNTREWNGFVQRREWRCRERGTVASVLPEKPSYGDWRAYCDGGFALEYAPLLEQRAEKGNEPRRDRGSILWCQLDVTSRTEPDPQADEIVRSLVCSLAKNLAGKDKAIALTPAAWNLARALTLDFQQDPKADPDPDPSRRVYLATTGAEKPEGLDEAVEAGARVLCLGFRADEVAAWSPVPLACAETNGCFSTPVAEPPPELEGLSAADLYWHGTMPLAAFTEPAPDGNEAFRVVRRGKGCYVFWQTPPSAFDEEARPALRGTKRHAWIALSRILSNLGCAWAASGVGYRDAPVADDDPYRYFRW